MLITFDADDFIFENADIKVSCDDGSTETGEYNDSADVIKISGWEVGSFADCWVKFYKEPKLDENGKIEIDGILCDVKAPGTHPGGRAWWCTPVEPVFVPIYETE